MRQPSAEPGDLIGTDRPSRREALALLYERHYAELVRLAFALTSDWGLAEELAQEAFVRVWRSWGNIRDPQAAPAYLRTTVANLARRSLPAGCKSAGPGTAPGICDQLIRVKASTCCARRTEGALSLAGASALTG